MSENICSYCQKIIAVGEPYHATNGIHACTKPACEKAFEQDTQFDTPLPEEVIRRWKEDPPNRPIRRWS